MSGDQNGNPEDFFPGSTSSMYHHSLPQKGAYSLSLAIAQQPGKKRQTMLTQTASAQRLIDEAAEREERITAFKQRQHYQKISSSWPCVPDRQTERDKLLKQLQQQCIDKEEERRHRTKSCRFESERAMAVDRECLQQDACERRKKADKMRQFGTGNKLLIEQREKDRRAQKKKEQEDDRRLLLKTPINWSHTLS